MSAYNVNVVMAGYVGPIDLQSNNPVEAIVKQAVELIDQQRPSQAIELVEKSIEQNPCSIPLHVLLTHLYVDTRRPAQARRIILRLQELGHKNPEFSVMLGLAWFNKRQFAEAILSFREAKVQGAPPGVGDAILAEALLRTGRIAEAEAMVERLLEELPDEARSRLLLDLSRIRLQQQRYQEAVNCALQALKATPCKTTVFYLLGLGFLRLGERERAVQAFEKYAEREPRWVAPYRYLERIAREAGDDAQADDYNVKAREILENRRLLRVEKRRLAPHGKM